MPWLERLASSAVALVDYAGFEPVQRLVAGAVVDGDVTIDPSLAAQIARLAGGRRLSRSRQQWTRVALDDAVDEAVFVDQREVEKREQKHFEQAIGQLERFVDDKVLVCRRERASIAEKLRSARTRRDEVVGSTARDRVEAEILRLAEKDEALERRISALDSREDEVYRKWRNEYHELRYRAPTVTRLFQVSFRIAPESGDVVLRLLHTADWHLGRRFPSFPEEAQKKLSRARMDVINEILDVGRRNAVNAVLCAGDLFDDPTPSRGLLGGAREDVRGIILGPMSRSSWCRAITIRSRRSRCGRRAIRFGRGFRHGCTSSTAMISRSSSRRTSSSTPARADRRRERTTWRWRCRRANPATRGCASAASMAARSTSTAIRRISRSAATRASSAGWTIWRSATRIRSGTSRRVCRSRPSTPARPSPRTSTSPAPAASHSSRCSGMDCVRASRRSRSRFWRWIDVTCRDINELRTLLTRQDLDRHVVRLQLDMTVSLAEENEVERILRDLQGTDATHGRAGVLLVDRTNLRLQPGSGGVFPDDLPPVVKDTIARLDQHD